MNLEPLHSNPQTSSQLMRSHCCLPLFHRIASPPEDPFPSKSNYKTDLAKACWLRELLAALSATKSQQ
ncbi:hypothetical protein CEXT_417921 [Caerostris extrusa]|uniref:Uncharacterized protein n=1 Tax=Caerostris extrusa TaxID=172846 RepID=A0AAV4SBB7_CAEEX|nr:hypothetical protein CEXT_417921 [Caerostris extrusa]